MNVLPQIKTAPATAAERAVLLALMRDELASRVDQLMMQTHLTWAEFEALGVEHGNLAARSLYLREGFSTERVLADLGFEMMRKRLGGPTAT